MSVLIDELKQKLVSHWSEVTKWETNSMTEFTEMLDNVMVPEIETIQSTVITQYEAKLLQTLREIKARGEGKPIDEIAQLIAVEMNLEKESSSE